MVVNPTLHTHQFILNWDTKTALLSISANLLYIPKYRVACFTQYDMIPSVEVCHFCCHISNKTTVMADLKAHLMVCNKWAQSVTMLSTYRRSCQTKQSFQSNFIEYQILRLWHLGERNKPRGTKTSVNKISYISVKTHKLKAQN